MKLMYNKRMKEYVSELTFISEKLKIYDSLLHKRKYYYTIKNTLYLKKKKTF